jgi:hypothetical protein
MNKRRIVLEISGVSAWDLGEALDSVPESDVFGIDRDYSRDTTRICLVSEHFAEVPDGQLAPVLTAVFEDDECTHFLNQKGEKHEWPKGKTVEIDTETTGVQTVIVDELAGFHYGSIEKHLLANRPKPNIIDYAQILNWHPRGYGKTEVMREYLEKWKAMNPGSKIAQVHDEIMIGLDGSADCLQGYTQKPIGTITGVRHTPDGKGAVVSVTCRTEECNCAYEGYKFHVTECHHKGPCR